MKPAISRIIIGLCLVGIGTIMVALQILVKPSTIEQSVVAQNTDQNTSPPSPYDTSVVNFIEPITISPEAFFNISSLPENTTLGSGTVATAIFRHALLPPSDYLAIHSFPILYKDEPVGVVSHIASKKTMGVSTLLQDVRRRLQNTIINDNPDERSLSGMQETRGAANFYLNDKENYPETVFLVTRSDQKVLAFEYEVGYHTAASNADFSFESIIPLLLQ